MDEKEALASTQERGFIFSSMYKVIVIILVIVFALFIGKILFGTRSLEVMLKLQKQESELQKTIKKSEEENAQLQKKLFEYQLTVPDDNSLESEK